MICSVSFVFVRAFLVVCENECRRLMYKCRRRPLLLGVCAHVGLSSFQRCDPALQQ